jgi:transposase
MSLARTRACTAVFFGPTVDCPSFAPREIHKTDTFRQRMFQSDSYMPISTVFQTIQTLKHEAAQRKTEKRQVFDRRVRQPKLPRDEQVNRKRQMIAACIMNQTKLNYRAVARLTKSDPATVKQVHWDLKQTGSPAVYTYNNLKDPQEARELAIECHDMPSTYSTVTDLKRLHPGFSRKFILKELHKQKRRWCKLRKEPLTKFKPPNSKDVCRVVSHVAQVLSTPMARMMYLDEMKLPFHQASEHQWTLKSEEQPMYTKRDTTEGGLTALALCSTHSFYAVQLFQREVTGDDFVFFLNNVIPTLPEGRRVSILADNATWHKSKAVMKSKGFKYLHFNVPHMFQLNLIENAFSAIRNEFRRRKLAENLEAEAKNIINLFFAEDNHRRFHGYYRNHLRMLQKFGELHSQQQHKEPQPEEQP